MIACMTKCSGISLVLSQLQQPLQCTFRHMHALWRWCAASTCEAMRLSNPHCFAVLLSCKVDLTARLREILINYPEGTSILKEIVQVH